MLVPWAASDARRLHPAPCACTERGAVPCANRHALSTPPLRLCASDGLLRCSGEHPRSHQVDPYPPGALERGQEQQRPRRRPPERQHVHASDECEHVRCNFAQAHTQVATAVNELSGGAVLGPCCCVQEGVRRSRCSARSGEESSVRRCRCSRGETVAEDSVSSLRQERTRVSGGAAKAPELHKGERTAHSSAAKRSVRSRAAFSRSLFLADSLAI